MDKGFLIVSLINFTITLIFYLLMVTIAAYAVEHFNASTSTAGLVSSILLSGHYSVVLGQGVLLETGVAKTLFCGLLLFMLSTMSYFIAGNLPLLMINRLVQGIALGIASTATGTIIAQILPAERRGEGIGYYSLSAILATAIGPFIGILLTQLFADYRMIFAVDSVLAIICFFMYYIVTVPDAPKRRRIQL